MWCLHGRALPRLLKSAGGTSNAAAANEARVGERSELVRILFLVPGPPPARFARWRISRDFAHRLCSYRKLMRACSQARISVESQSDVKWIRQFSENLSGDCGFLLMCTVLCYLCSRFATTISQSPEASSDLVASVDKPQYCREDHMMTWSHHSPVCSRL